MIHQLKSFLFFLNKLYATGGGMGYSPYAPGTIASIITCFLLFMISYDATHYIAIIIILGFLGILSSHILIQKSGLKDPSYIVIDEIVGMMIATALLPKNFWMYAGALCLFRYLDIKKPYLISWAEKAPGGLGVMLDDLLAGSITRFIIFMIQLYL